MMSAWQAGCGLEYGTGLMTKVTRETTMSEQAKYFYILVIKKVPRYNARLD